MGRYTEDEKILKETDWYDLYQITEPRSKPTPPYVYVSLGVKNCPVCKSAYSKRYKKIFQCDYCGFKFQIKTPLKTKIKNLIRFANA